MKTLTKIIQLFLLNLALGMLSCQTIIDIDLPTHEPALVLNSFFGTDTTFMVTLHESKDILDPSYDFKAVSDATIELFENNMLIGSFLAVEGEPGNYYLNIHPQPGVNYSIVASRTGYEAVKAQDIIPIAKTNPSIEKFETSYDEYDYPTYQMTYSINDLIGEDYYQVTLYVYLPRYEYYEDEDTSYYYQNGYWKDQIYYNEVGADLNEFEDTGDKSIFSDELFDGRKVNNTIEFSYYYYDDNGNSKNEEAKISLEVRHISSSYYRYEVSRRLQQDTQGNPFAEAAPVYNNIKGGYGIFAGYDVETVDYEHKIKQLILP